MRIETEQEIDGRWIVDIDGIMVYGRTRIAAILNALILWLKVRYE